MKKEGAYCKPKRKNQHRSKRQDIQSLSIQAENYFNEGILLSRQGKYKAAIEKYQRSIKLHPNDSDAYYNMGTAYAVLKDNDNACACFKAVIHINPKDIQAYNNLGVIFAKQEQFEASLQSFRNALAIDFNYIHALINICEPLNALERYEEALAFAHRALKIQPNDIRILICKGIALNGLMRLDEAIAVFNNALKLDPRNDKILNCLAVAYKNNGQNKQAMVNFEAALEINPNKAAIWINLGLMHRQQLDMDQAIQCYHKAIHLSPDNVAAYANMANVLEECNQLDMSQKMVDRALQLNPHFLLANYLEAKLAFRKGAIQKAYDLLEDASVRLATDKSFSGLSTFFSLQGKVLHQMGQFDEAFEAFHRANQVDAASPCCKQIQISSQKDLEEIRKLRGWFSDFQVRQWNCFDTVKDDGPEPIFLVGFPRSGTTLLEQILKSHSNISTLDEKPTMNALILNFTEAPEGLERLSDEQIAQGRRAYWQTIKKYMNKKRVDTVVVDKMPLNLIYLGIIHRFFPKAKIILAIRHPLDVVLSCFMQRFSLNTKMYNFLSLEGTVNYYDLVMDLCFHYQQILPLNIHVLRYEDLLNNFEMEIKHLLVFLGLDWQERLKKYHVRAKEKFISTPSYTEVVKPIHHEALYRWTHYKDKLSRARHILDRYIVHFDYTI